jgi:signal transduction histidine kinase
MAVARDARSAGRAQVLVRYAPQAVELEVRDDGAGDGATEPLGVRERVLLYGGELHVRRRRSGGHALRARLPLREVP